MNISDLLCDLYDIRRMAELEGFGNLPKDNDGTETTIMECLDHCITSLLEEQRNLSRNKSISLMMNYMLLVSMSHGASMNKINQLMNCYSHSLTKYYILTQ